MSGVTTSVALKNSTVLSTKGGKKRVLYISDSLLMRTLSVDKFLTDHPEFEFIQLQINYLDWNSEGVRPQKVLRGSC